MFHHVCERHVRRKSLNGLKDFMFYCRLCHHDMLLCKAPAVYLLARFDGIDFSRARIVVKNVIAGGKRCRMVKQVIVVRGAVATRLGLLSPDRGLAARPTQG